MTADKPTPVVPNLRFPEFQKTPAWCVELLGCLFRERKETGLSELPLLSVTDREGVIPQEQTNRKNISSSNKSKYLRVVPGDIAYNTMRMWEGRSARVGIEGVVSPAYTVCLPGADTNTKFFAYYFKTDSLIRQFRKVSQGLVKDTLNLKYKPFSHIPVGFPPPDEQQMIADCLGSLDDLIAAEGRKLEALRQHKQGLMQQLFPQPGETVPRLRFPEFLNGSTWDELIIGDVCDLKAGDFIPASEIAEHEDEGSFPCYGGNGFRGYVKSFTHEGRYVLVGRQGALCGNVSLYTGKFHATEHALVATPKPGVDTGWLFYALDALKLNRFSIGQAQPGLSVGVLRDVGILVPIGEDEQQKIADCLGSLDDLIAAEGRKLDALRQHKQGLMQQLFPSLEAESR